MITSYTLSDLGVLILFLFALLFIVWAIHLAFRLGKKEMVEKTETPLVVKEESQKPLAVGDIVRLRSDGQDMTVARINLNDTISCMWHDRNGVPHIADYYEEMLWVTEDN
jgi:uncharacterized protein YodC (DUF2158 family)